MGIDILAPYHSGRFPKANFKQLRRVFPELLTRAGRKPFGKLSRAGRRKLSHIGLAPSERSWPVVLPGYVFHAMDDGNFPYLPKSFAEASYPPA